MNEVTIATEDQLSEALLSRVVSEFSPRLTVANALGRRGNGHLRARLMSLVAAARAGMRVILLTDADGQRSPDAVRADWMADLTFDSERFYLAVAVQEAEAWLLADSTAVEAVLGRGASSIPAPTDELINPKEWLLNEARRSARQIREQLIRDDHGRVKVGVGYNSITSRVVSDIWSPQRARRNSRSLDRLMSDLLSW